MASADEQRQQQKDLWSAAAPGWERRDAWFDRQSRVLTEWLLAQAGVAAGKRVLDLACGSGQPSLSAAARVGPGGAVVATDLSPQMLAVTERKARALGLDNVELAVMDAEQLRFPDASFDAVTCRFGLMFCPDPARAASEIRRVLRPGGRFAVAVWDEPHKNPFFTTIAKPLASFVPTPPPDPTAPGVFRLAPPGELEAVLRAGGFSEVRVESLPFVAEYASLEEYWTVQTDLAAPLRAAIATLPAAQVEELKAAVFAALAPHLEGGRVRLDAVPLGGTGAK
jgi:ubiquinone/menaquinone biosynthesis C-methylase UbiE